MWVFLAAAGSGYLAKYLHNNNNNVQENKEAITTDEASPGDNKFKGSGRNFKTSGAGEWADCNWQTHTGRAILDKASLDKPMEEEGESSAQMGSFKECLVVESGISSSLDSKGISYHSLQKPNVNLIVSQAEKIDVDANAVGTGTGTCLPFVSETLDCCDSLESNGKLREPDVRNGCAKLEDGDQFEFPECRGKSTQQDNYARENGENSADIIGHYYDYDSMQVDSGFGHMLQPDSSQRHKFKVSRFGREKKPLGRYLRISSKPKPMSSLESCLFAQLTGENIKHHFDESGVSSSFLFSSVANQRPLIVTDGSRIISRGEVRPLLGLQFPSMDHGLHYENGNILDEDEPAYGLPSLPLVRGLKKSQGRRTEQLAKLQISNRDSMSSQNSRNDDDAITAAGSATQKRRKAYEYGPFASSQVASSKRDTSAGCLLFSFGIGVGIMFAIMSSRKEIERLKYLLRQTEELVEDLEEELKMHDSLTVKDLTGEAHNAVETWRDPFAEGHGTRHTSSDKLPEAGCEIGERTPIEEPEKRMENMTRVEAELEAELERLELNLKHQRKFSGLSEIDPDCIADVVHGELNGHNLMGNTESDEDNSAFTHEEIHTGNYAVSPRDLARRLNEVRESRLHERIIELEAELEATQTKLQAFESGYQQSKALNQDIQSFISGSEVPAMRHNYLESQSDYSAGNRSSLKASSHIPYNQKEVCHRIIKELSEGSGSQAMDLNGACSEAKGNQNTDDKESEENQNLPLFLTLSGDALSAYNEAYDEFMKVSSEKEVTMFDSIEIKNVPPTKQSFVVDNQALKYLPLDDSLESNDTRTCHCYKEDDLQEKDGKCISHPDPFLLLSANCWNIMGSHPQCTQGSCSSSELYSLTSPNKMELGSEGIGLKSTDFPDCVLEDTSGSTPCSIKFVDTSLIHSNCNHDKSLGMNIAPEPANLMVNMDTLCRKDVLSTNTTALMVEQCRLQMPSVNLIPTRGKKKLFSVVDQLPEVSTTVLDKIRSWDTLARVGASEFDTEKTLCHEVGHGKMPDSEPHLFDQSNTTSDDSGYVSEVDDQLGKLLIERIIEKRRQGSPIVEKAESIFASLEKNDQNFH